MRKHWFEILFVVILLAFIGAVTYVFKNNLSSIPPKYALTSQTPVVSLDNKGQILVRTDCTIEEYRNCIGQLAQQILDMQKPKATEPTAK